MKKVSLLLIAFFIAVSGYADSVSAEKITALYMVDMRNTYVGGAQSTALYDGIDGHFQLQNHSRAISIRFQGIEKELHSSGDWWHLDFNAGNQKLQKGVYKNATRAGFNRDNPGLDFGGCGCGYNELKGEFEVLEIEYANNGQVEVFAANFNISKNLFGTVRYNSAVPIEECFQKLCENKANAIFQTSNVNGERLLEYISLSEVSLHQWPHENGVSLSFQGNKGIWVLDFAASCGDKFISGIYENAEGPPSHDSSKPWISITTPEGEQISSGCFQVLEIQKARNGKILSLAVDFMAEKDNGEPLNGSIRYQSQRTLRFLEPTLFLDSEKAMQN